MQSAIEHASQANSAEGRLWDLAIHFPVPPERFATYTETVQVGSLVFLSGKLATERCTAKFDGRVEAELDTAAGREATWLAPMDAVAIACQDLCSLDRVRGIVRPGVSVATGGDVRDRPKVADEASEFLQEMFDSDKNPTRLCMETRTFHLEFPLR